VSGGSCPESGGKLTVEASRGEYSIPSYKRWGSLAELTWHSQCSTPYGIRFSHKIYRPSPTKDVTWKDPSLIRGPLIGGCTVCLLFAGECCSEGRQKSTSSQAVNLLLGTLDSASQVNWHMKRVDVCFDLPRQT
jgi:hypothetical protein